MMTSINAPLTPTTPQPAPPMKKKKKKKKKKAVIIGGGPVGSLSALYFSKSGWDVEVYELRPGKNISDIDHLKLINPLTCLLTITYKKKIKNGH